MSLVAHRPAQPHERVLVALDVANLDQALTLVETLRDQVGGFKVGMELCYAEGTTRVVEAVAAAGGRVFLDLKLHDIPNTVESALRGLLERVGQHVMLLTLHTSGGAAMLRAASSAVAGSQLPLGLLGVTLLTSIDSSALREELHVPLPALDYVVSMARLAQQSGLAGVVASPLEASEIRAACGPELLIVTPGVRPHWASAGDQRRVLSPSDDYHP